jgi:arsenite methyltransferase
MNADWIGEALGGSPPREGETVTRHGVTLVGRGGLARDVALAGELDAADAAQAQTRDMFAFKWRRRDSYASPEMLAAQRRWLDERLDGRDLLARLGPRAGARPLALDAGCGAGFSAKLLFENRFEAIRYVAVDISTAVDIAAEEIAAPGRECAFLQCDLMRLPFASGVFDIVVSEGVLHHTPSTRRALLEVARRVAPGGLLMAYVYARKAPIREFTDDHIRAAVADMTPQQAWTALEPLTRLGVALGELKTQIDVPDVPLLGIKAGRYDIQRLFYWAICKAYYRPEFSFDEMNHINFDWFTPKYCHRQTPQEVVAWCGEAGLVIEHLRAEEAGITVVARRPAAAGRT